MFSSIFKRGVKTKQNPLNATESEKKGACHDVKDGVLTVSDGYVEDGKYAGNDSIRKVVFTDKVYRIRSEAFKDCRNLTQVEFLSSKYRFPEIFSDAFANTPWAREQGDWVKYEDVLLFYQGEPKQKLMIPADVKYIHQLFYVHKQADETREIEFEPGAICDVICEEAFSFCEKLERIVFPDTPVHILNNAFLGSKALKEIIFQKQLPSLKKDSFQACIRPTVYIPSEAIKPEDGWNIPSEIIRKRLDYWLMMLKAEQAECFANGTTYNTLLNYAIKECEQLGEFAPGADEDTIHHVLSQFHYLNVLKKDTPEYDCESTDLEWYAFPKDHFYCRMVYCLFHNFVVKPKDLRKDTIALCLKDEKRLSTQMIENIRQFVDTIGLPIAIFWRSGHLDGVIANEDDADDIKKELERLGKGAWLEKDEHPEEIGDLYLELLSGKQYYVESDWRIKSYTERYDGGYDEEFPYIAFEHYLMRCDE